MDECILYVVYVLHIFVCICIYVRMHVSIHDTYVCIHNRNFRYIIVFQKERESSLEYIIQLLYICM
jgi:hypothetical protein